MKERENKNEGKEGAFIAQAPSCWCRCGLQHTPAEEEKHKKSISSWATSFLPQFVCTTMLCFLVIIRLNTLFFKVESTTYQKSKISKKNYFDACPSPSAAERGFAVLKVFWVYAPIQSDWTFRKSVNFYQEKNLVLFGF